MIDSTIRAALRQHFEFDDFRMGQREVIENLMAGNSAAAVFPTGSGKSLCYQLPALLLDGLTLVVSPLIALMKDQIDALRARGIPARRLDSTLSGDEYRAVLTDIRSGDLRLLYVAPERFNNERFRTQIQQAKVALFAVDEAHCISEWGHNFRPDYLKLPEFSRLCGAERTLALTATATPQVLRDICRGFDIPLDCATCTGFYRPNLRLVTTSTDRDERDTLLRRRLATRAAGSTIVYVTAQRTAETVADMLCQYDLEAKPYHAGMKTEVRTATQDWFLGSASGIVVATIAFGMGVDKPDIRYVYHYNLPKSLENYSQEIGRAGRDGENAVCEMFACLDDLKVLKNFAYNNTPSLAAVQDLIRILFAQEDSFDVSYYELASTCGMPTLAVRTLLTYLELDGYVVGGTPFYANYRFKPKASSRQILARLEGERREFVRQILAQARKAKAWFDLDVDTAARVANASRERVTRALDYLAELQLLEVSAAGVRNRYQQLKACPDADQLAGDLHARAVARQERDIARLYEVVNFARATECQVSRLCKHFGEALPKSCGHCGACDSHSS